eukprot:5640315-Amphidinium_carterae.1
MGGGVSFACCNGAWSSSALVTWTFPRSEGAIPGKAASLRLSTCGSWSLSTTSSIASAPLMAHQTYT